MNMTQQAPPARCRIVLTYDIRRGISTDIFRDILAVGDVASVILYNLIEDSAFFQKEAEKLVPLIQDAMSSAIIAEDSQIAGRVKADGLHLEGSWQDLENALTKHSPAMMIGYGNPRDRHSAMKIGEMQPDYVFFGKLGKDKKPTPHPRNLGLGEWWASMIELPCIVQAGSDPASVIAAAASGAEFVALEEAVFAAQDMPHVLRQANRLLDENAPVIGD